MQKIAEEILKEHYDIFSSKYPKENIYGWKELLKDKTTMEILFPSMKEYARQEAELAWEACIAYMGGADNQYPDMEQYINERFK